MKNKKLPQFELSTKGEIYEVTFNFKTSVDDFTEEHKKWYKTLTENVRTEYYIVDKNGNYILLNKITYEKRTKTRRAMRIFTRARRLYRRLKRPVRFQTRLKTKGKHFARRNSANGR